MNLEKIYHWYTASGALVAELSPETNLENLMQALAPLGGLVCFDSSSATVTGPSYDASTGSSGKSPSLDRYSFVAADPIVTFVVPDGTGSTKTKTIQHVLEEADSQLANFSCQTIPGLPPFQGGLAGMISFDAGLSLLGIEFERKRGSDVPLLQFGMYDVVFAFDHKQNKVWAFSRCARPNASRSTGL
jgi:para-aminobenzoate synthetase component 1